MAPQQSPAQALIAKAEKKASSSSGWFSTQSTKWEEAGDLYQQAANAFKLEKTFQDAGDAFAKEAECREKCGETSEASNAFWNAAKAYKQTQRSDLAIQALGLTVTHLTKAGRFRQAADREKEIGQIYIQEGNMSKACESYERAAEWYSQEDAHATANACYKDAADLYAQLEAYPQAINLYDKVAEHSLGSALTKYSVKEYWLRASLCALANRDTVTARRNMARYTNLDNGFANTREAKFVNSIIGAVENVDLQEFTNACGDFDQVTHLDNWKTAILLKIKKTIDEEPALL